eukprot:TRINITY_DN3604_c0_g1_i1.p1 TRINITY_DN3604_c0_g1~~TRINITY_DN3604_c0_g1_i1.p1  ORF type:complete len:1313 (+),score=242.86 TRINITY_DN3604_c0_g1_i1:582-3941(+)
MIGCIILISTTNCDGYTDSHSLQLGPLPRTDSISLLRRYADFEQPIPVTGENLAEQAIRESGSTGNFHPDPMSASFVSVANLIAQAVADLPLPLVMIGAYIRHSRKHGMSLQHYAYLLSAEYQASTAAATSVSSPSTGGPMPLLEFQATTLRRRPILDTALRISLGYLQSQHPLAAEILFLSAFLGAEPVPISFLLKWLQVARSSKIPDVIGALRVLRQLGLIAHRAQRDAPDDDDSVDTSSAAAACAATALLISSTFPPARSKESAEVAPPGSEDAEPTTPVPQRRRRVVATTEDADDDDAQGLGLSFRAYAVHPLISSALRTILQRCGRTEQSLWVAHTISALQPLMQWCKSPALSMGCSLHRRHALPVEDQERLQAAGALSGHCIALINNTCPANGANLVPRVSWRPFADTLDRLAASMRVESRAPASTQRVLEVLLSFQRRLHQIIETSAPPGTSGWPDSMNSTREERAVEMAWTLSHLAAVMGEQGNIAGSKQVFAEAVLTAQTCKGLIHYKVIAAALSELGHMLRASGDREGALRYLRDGLRFRRRIAGETASLDVALALGDVGNILRELDNADAAMDLLLEALSLQRVVLGNECINWDVVPNLAGVGMVLHALGDPTHALQYLESARTMRRVLEENASEPSLEGSKIAAAMGAAASEIGNRNDALNHYREAVEMVMSVYGDRGYGPEVSGLFVQIGLLHIQAGELDLALQKLNEALAYERRIKPSDDYEVPANVTGINARLAAVYGALGQCFLAREELRTARWMLEKGRAIRQQLLGERTSDIELVKLYGLMGDVFLAQREFAASKERYEQSVTLARELFPDEETHPLIVQGQTNIRAVETAESAVGGPEELLQFEETVKQKRDGYDSPRSTAAALNNMGEILRSRGDLEGARQKLEEALVLERLIHGEAPNADVATTLNNLGGVYYAQRDFVNAQRRLDEGFAVLQALHGENPHPEKENVLFGLGAVHTELGNKDLAEMYMQRSREMRDALGLHRNNAITPAMFNLFKSELSSLGPQASAAAMLLTAANAAAVLPGNSGAGKSAAVPVQFCAHCQQSKPDMQRCTRCRTVLYCSKDCQRADWKVHKALCKEPQSSGPPPATGTVPQRPSSA